MRKTTIDSLSTLSLQARRPIDVAREYCARGWTPIPVPHRQKSPDLPEWQNVRTTEENVEKFFSTHPSNIGVLLGDPSGGLVDVDLDCAEAVRAAPFFLPGPTVTFGRESRATSHYLYIAADAPKLKLLDPIAEKKGEKLAKVTIIELRSTGHQTVFPGSTHTSGEAIEWSRGAPTSPLAVDGHELARAVRHTAAASLLARHWPPGTRQDASLALAGALLRNGWSPHATKNFLRAVAVAASDEEADKRVACVADTNKKLAAHEETTGWPTLTGILEPKTVTKLQAWLGCEGSANGSVEGDDETEHLASPKVKQADMLVRLALDGCTLFHDSSDTAYARTKEGAVLRLRSQRFRSLLDKLFFDAHKSTTGGGAKTDALGTLEGIAIHSSPKQQVFVRVGEDGNRLYVDLANDKHEVVEIQTSGWSILTDCPIQFFRPRGMLPLPRPVDDGDVIELYEFLNVASTDEFVLIVSWLVAALRCRGPYPILVLQGRHGSAKSSTSRILRALTDPNAAPIRTPPRDTRDLAIAAQNAQVLAFDNLSGVPDWLSDAMCRVATGGGFATRELYSDGEEKIFSATRPIILNGIDDILARPDLADRALVVTLPEIPADRRRDEKSISTAFATAAPRILGALLDGLARGLKHEPSLTLEATPRMADFVRSATAALPAFGLPSKSLVNAMAKSKAEATAVALDADRLAHAILALLDEVGGRWSGTASELLAAVHAAAVRGDIDRDAKRELPSAANVLTNRLRRIAPTLAEVGVRVLEKRHATGRHIELVRARESSPSSSSSPVLQRNQGDTRVDASRRTFSRTVTVPRLPKRDGLLGEHDGAGRPDRHPNAAPFPPDDGNDDDDDRPPSASIPLHQPRIRIRRPSRQ